MSNNPPIIPRKNSLAEKINEIVRINEEYGTRAQGGGAPIIPDPDASAPISAPVGGVLPPEPKPLTPEEEADLQRAFDEQWNARGEAGVPVMQGAPAPLPNSRIVPGLGEIPTGFAAIDLVNNQIVATNGAVYPINDKEQKELLQFAFRKMLSALDQNVGEVAASLGIEWPPQPQAQPASEQASGDGEAVSSVPGNQTPQGVGQEQIKA